MNPFCCTICNAPFSSAQQLSRHHTNTHNGATSSGGMIGFISSGSTRIPQSQTSSGSTVRISCRTCNRSFGSAIDFIGHNSSGGCRRNASGLSAGSATSASAPGWSPNPLLLASRHLSASTSQTSDRTCNGCQKTFRNSQSLLAHRNGAPNTSVRFPCDAPQCAFASCSESGLQGHRQSLRHFTPARSQVMFTESRVVQVSQPQYQPPDMSTFWEFINQTRYTSCPQCSQQILRVELVRHMAENHPIFRCSDCNEIFDNRSELDSHHSSGSSLQEIMKTVCPCGDSFASRLEAIRHIHENREDEDHFTFCFHCELSFESIADYVCHHERLHDNLYPPNFLCKDSTPAHSRSTIKQQTQQSTEEGKITLTCIICLGFPEKLTATGCGHLYCNECITSCLKIKSECPACRKRTTAAELRGIFV